MDEAARYLIGQGILGVVCLTLGWWILRKDKAHSGELVELRRACDAEKTALLAAFTTEKDARIKDAQSYAGMSLQLQRDVLTYVSDAKVQDAKVADSVSVLAVKVAEQEKSVEELTAWVIDRKVAK